MKLILFLHIERTGGSTVNGWFASTQNTFTRNINYFEFPGGINLPKETFQKKDIDYTFISSHTSIAEAKSKIDFATYDDILIFSILRDPIQRIISGYKLWLRSPDWFPELYGIEKNFLQYYKKTKNTYSNNLACRRLGNEESHQAALHQIASNKILIGETNSLGIFASNLKNELISRKMKIDLITNITSSNEGQPIGKHDYLKHGISEEVFEQLTCDNKEDILLKKSLEEN